jgi:DnaJ-class molecular chaperone
MKNKNTTTCPGCGGSGQISFFQGESRFLLTMEECPECNGTGMLVRSEPTRKSKKKKQIKNNGNGK